MTQEEKEMFKEWNLKLNKSFYSKVINANVIWGGVLFLILAVSSIVTHNRYSLLTGVLILLLMCLAGIGKVLAGIGQTLDEIKDKMNKENSENKENPEE